MKKRNIRKAHMTTSGSFNKSLYIWLVGRRNGFYSSFVNINKNIETNFEKNINRITKSHLKCSQQ